MKKKLTVIAGGQASREQAATMQQLLLPMVAGLVATKQSLLDFVVHVGLQALEAVLGQEAELLVGPKGKHQSGRQVHRWGTAPSQATLGGRRVQVRRPRVRSTNGQEVALDAWKQMAAADPLPARVVEQLVLGVSTRGYDRSLEPMPKGVKTRGTSKSNASRHFIAETKRRMKDFLNQRLADVDLCGLFIDGLVVAEYTVVVALGVSRDGTKLPLGVWLGSTENATVCTALLNNLIERGLRIDHPILAVIDGGKGIRRAIHDVLGKNAVVQRCQRHKTENVLGHLPKKKHPYVLQQLRAAYGSERADTARKLLRRLVAWLENNGEPDAASSLREGMEETLTVLKLALPRSLRRSFATTNVIENTNGTLRRVAHNVKRWRDGKMVQRWVTLGLTEAARKFRRLKGFREMPRLVAALEEKSVQLASEAEAA
jgi:putative transposase